MEKTTGKVKSELLLSLKDIEKLKEGATDNKGKIEHKAKTIDSSLEKYNQSYVKALEAPVPPIKLHFNEVLVRAVPFEVKTKSGIILGVSDSDFKLADKLERMSDAVDQFQEILMVGDMITEDEQQRGIRPGRMCKIRLDRFRQLSDRHHTGMIETEYNIPIEVIDGYKYIIIDKRDIIYTRDKE